MSLQIWRFYVRILHLIWHQMSLFMFWYHYFLSLRLPRKRENLISLWIFTLELDIPGLPCFGPGISFYFMNSLCSRTHQTQHSTETKIIKRIFWLDKMTNSSCDVANLDWRKKWNRILTWHMSAPAAMKKITQKKTESHLLGCQWPKRWKSKFDFCNSFFAENVCLLTPPIFPP